MQLDYLPPILFFADLQSVAKLEFDLNEQYDRRTNRNRSEIMSANGKLLLVIPTERIVEKDRPYKSIKISYSEPWQKKHWKSIEAGYRRSPYFEYYEYLFSPFYNQKSYEYLWEFNLGLLKVIFLALKLEQEISMINDKISLNDKSKTYYLAKYKQVFDEKIGFVPNLSCIDLLFNLGPDAKSYLENIKQTTIKL